MGPAQKFGPVLLLSALLCASGVSGYSLDAPAVRAVLEAAMRCQSVRQLHAAAVHRGGDLFSVRLELQPDGQVKDIVDKKLLYLASVSKGMFGTGLVRVEQHLKTALKKPNFSLFNTPIKQLLGDANFWFLDHVRSDLVTIDDLISHRTGLARHDAMWYLFEWQSKQDLVNNFSRLTASADFRGSFVYNNLVWSLADVVVERLTNRTFVQYMQEHLWHPLDMRDTFGSSQMTDTALHSRVDFSRGCMTLGQPLEMSKMERGTRFVEAAGGILTSLSDMMKYMKLHASQNYSVDDAPPGQFRALNALAAESGMNAFFNRQLYNGSLTADLPDWDIESYGRGWLRTWYRNRMDYSHGGSLLGIRSELDIFPKENLAVFNHMTLGPADKAPYQAFYAVIINKYIADLLLTNQSFVTKDNVCSLLKQFNTPEDVVSIPRRHLTNEEVDALQGSYGSYGFGKVQVTFNKTLKTMTMTYGIAVMELIPVVVQPQPQPYHFVLALLEPRESSSLNMILNRTDDAIVVPRAAQQNPQIYLTVSREPDGGLAMLTPIIDPHMKLHRDLDPNTWTRPKLCPEGKSAGRVARAAGGADLAVAAAILGVLAASSAGI